MVAVGPEDIDRLKELAQENSRKRMRLCTHDDVADSLHEMFIVHELGAYVRPHKHLGKVESFHVIEGAVDVVVFDDQGNITKLEPVSDYSSGKAFYHRISDPSFHTLLIRSDVLVFHEVTTGPFRNEDTEFPPWAPKDIDGNSVRDFLTELDGKIENFLSRTGQTQ